MEATSVLTAALSDRYTIDREIGAGGMATVYLAHDLKHDRDVAIKVLHPDLAAALGGDRFLAEIRTTAKLQHPHILPLLDSGSADGLLYYVMPLVTGESLRSRMERERQLPIEDAVRIARECAGALDYAHRHGVIHRDIKPENILLHDGSAMVADFGIALAVQTAGGQRMTQTGLSLGTPQYMSPEQAMGERSIDARSDIYALGAVTYEMLAGEPPYSGATVQAIVAKVLTSQPEPITTVRRNVSPQVAAAVHRSLEKLPADRFATAAEYSAALISTADVAGSGRTTSAAGHDGRRRAFRSIALAVLALTAVVVAFAVGRRGRPSNDGLQAPLFATIEPQEGDSWRTEGNSFAIAPNGRRVVVTVERGGEGSLAIASLDSLGQWKLPNTRNAIFPFWSPDGGSIGFFADKQMKTLNLTTGAVRALCPAARPMGASWGSQGIIIFVPERSAGVQTVSATEGSCSVGRRFGDKVRTGVADVGRPYFLPDGHHFLITTASATWIGELGSDSLSKLVGSRSKAVFAVPDYLLFGLLGSPEGTISAQRIEAAKRTLLDQPVQILNGIANPNGQTAIDASAGGALVASIRLDARHRIVATIDRPTGRVDIDTAPGFFTFRVAHDGRRIAYGGWTLETRDIARRVSNQLIPKGDSAKRSAFYPLWSPGDTLIAFVQGSSGQDTRVVVVDTRSAGVRALFSPPDAARSVTLTDWSRDGRYLAFAYGAGRGAIRSEAWVYDATSGQSRSLFKESGDVQDIRFSPNAKWVAYQSDVSGDMAVYVRPFPGPGPAIRISPAVGRVPHWSEGGELFYLRPSGEIRAVRISSIDGAATSDVRAVAAPAVVGASAASDFDVAPDGNRFFVQYKTADRGALTVILGWQKLLDRVQ